MSEEKIDVKIGSKEEKFWFDLEKKVKEAIQMAKHDIEINEHLLILAQTRLAEESEKLK